MRQLKVRGAFGTGSYEFSKQSGARILELTRQAMAVGSEGCGFCERKQRGGIELGGLESRCAKWPLGVYTQRQRSSKGRRRLDDCQAAVESVSENNKKEML